MSAFTIEKTISAEQQQVWEVISDIETTPECLEVMKSLIAGVCQTRFRAAPDRSRRGSCSVCAPLD